MMMKCVCFLFFLLCFVRERCYCPSTASGPLTGRCCCCSWPARRREKERTRTRKKSGAVKRRDAVTQVRSGSRPDLTHAQAGTAAYADGRSRFMRATHARSQAHTQRWQMVQRTSIVAPPPALVRRLEPRVRSQLQAPILALGSGRSSIWLQPSAHGGSAAAESERRWLRSWRRWLLVWRA